MTGAGIGSGEGGPDSMFAEGLVQGFVEDPECMDELLDEVFENGSESDVTDAASVIRRDFGEDRASEFMAEVRSWADMVLQDVVSFELFVVGLILDDGGSPPPSRAIADRLAESGEFAGTSIAAVANGWYAAADLVEMTPFTARRVLLDLVSGSEPRDLRLLPHGSDGLAPGFVCLVGIKRCDDVMDEPTISVDQDGESSVAPFIDWLRAVMQDHPQIAYIHLPSPVFDLGDNLNNLVENGIPDDETALFRSDIEELFSIARREAGEAIACFPAIQDDRLSLEIYADDGRLIDVVTRNIHDIGMEPLAVMCHLRLQVPLLEAPPGIGLKPIPIG